MKQQCQKNRNSLVQLNLAQTDSKKKKWAYGGNVCIKQQGYGAKGTWSNGRRKQWTDAAIGVCSHRLVGVFPLPYCRAHDRSIICPSPFTLIAPYVYCPTRPLLHTSIASYAHCLICPLSALALVSDHKICFVIEVELQNQAEFTLSNVRVMTCAVHI